MITVISVYASVLGFAVTGTKANPGAENVVTYITPASTTFRERQQAPGKNQTLTCTVKVNGGDALVTATADFETI